MTELLVLCSSEQATSSPASSPEKKLAMKTVRKSPFLTRLAMKNRTQGSSLSRHTHILYYISFVSNCQYRQGDTIYFYRNGARRVPLPPTPSPAG